MASANYWQRGETLDYLNSGNDKIDAGSIIVLGARVGIAGCDIAAGQLGSVHVEGVYAFPKKDSTAIVQGAEVYWDAETPGVTATEDDDYIKIGYAAQAAQATDTTILVKINA